MEGKKLLIAGIDPGTTTGFAVLGIKGNLLHLNSSKQFDLKLLISEAIKLGKVVLVGTDKVKAPSLVEAFATKIGGRIVSPHQDLRVEEKRKMTSDFDFADEHQGDALASALFAYRETKPLLDKIDFFAEENKKQDIADSIKENVIAKRISIKSAVAMIEKKEKEPRIIEKVIADKKLDEGDFLKLHSKLKRYENEIRVMRRYNNALNNRISGLEKQARAEKPKGSIIRAADFREKRIRFLEDLVKSKEKKIWQLKSLMDKFSSIISDIGNFYILKKLDTLGINEFNFRNKILNVQRNDIILVDNPNIVSNSVIELLKNRIFVIVYKKPIDKKVEASLPFVFISAKNLKIDEHVHFGFVEKRHFEMEKNKVGWAKKIIDDYRREKEQLI